MRTSVRFLFVFLVLFPLAAFAQPVVMTASLNGTNERPNPADPDGVGYAIVRLDPNAGTVTYTIVSQGVPSPGLAHIHRGTSDVAGPVVIDFAPAFTNGAASGTVNASKTLINEIIANPGAFYVNVHNAEFPAGAIRGQLVGPASLGTTFGATLLGANEKPNPGDPDGNGFAIVRIDTTNNKVQYAIVTRNIAPPGLAHIHRGTADVAGPVVVDFHPTFFQGSAAGTVDADPTILAEILANPAGFYVNVHNADFPAGAIRGQLVASGAGATDVVFPIVGSAEGANNTFYRTDLALLNLSGAETAAELQFYPSGDAGNSSPTATATLILASGEQVNLNGDNLRNVLNVPAGTGALRVVSTRAIHAVARIYNDLRVGGGGTLSQFVPSFPNSWNLTTGALPMLSNGQPASSLGYRTNIGWFNGTAAASTVTFRVHRPNGTVLETSTRTVQPGAQQQVSLNALFPSLEPLDQLYVTFSTTGAPLYVYASVVDNVNGDGIFIPAR
ncbi:MAG: CHRD domain-containing protein [Thermoanaerobaculia bacterium]